MCLASGPSMSQEVADFCRGKARVIAVSDSYRLAPWADVLYACDATWWHLHGPQGALGFAGLKVGLDDSITFPAVRVLQRSSTESREGFDPRPTHLADGANSGYQAVHLAAHMGAARVLLAGFDMRQVDGRSHFFGEHPEGLTRHSPYPVFVKQFKTLVEPLRERGVEVINVTPGSALTVFPIGELEEVLDG